MTKRILSIILVWMGCLTLWAQSSGGGYGGDFNPTNPDDPAVPDKPQVVVTYRLTLQATVGGTVSHNQSGSDFQAGTRLRLTASPQANYKFVHWVQGETVVSTQTSFYYTMPAEAVTLQAVFEFYPGAYGGDMNPSDPSQPGISVKSYKLTASAVGNGSVSCSSSSVQMGTSAYVSATANTGYRFTGWMCEGELVSTEPYYPFVMDNRDAHYTAHFEFAPSSPNQPSSGGAVAAYTLTYRIGGRNYYSEQLTVGTRITPIDNPVRKGHTFNGWSVIPDSMPSRNVTIDGSFTAARHELQFVVNGEVIKKDSVAYGTVIVAPDVDATGEKAFQWHNMPGIMPDHDVVVSGVYSSIKYNVIYRVDGEEYKRVEYDEGAPIYYEIPPIKEGYTFDGWVGVPTVMPQNYVVATGSLKPSTTFNLVYIIDGLKYHTERIAAGAPVTLLVPEKESYLFTGWNETLTTMPNHDVYLEGSFVFAIFNITYLVDGEVYKTVRTPVDNVIAPVAAPAKEGYTFTGWTGLPDKMPAKDITVSASYAVNRYKVTYMLDGAVHYTDSVTYGTPLTALAAPSKEGHTFSGWSGLPATMPAKDVIVTGSLAVNTYKVTYVVDGVVYKDSTYTYGAAVDAVAEPTKEGHTFSGWSGIPVTMPAKDVTVTGSFTVNTYKLTYTYAGEVYHTDSIAYGAVVKAVEVPVKEGYTFSGWVGLPETMPAKDVTVDGTYTINSYKVTYVVDGVVYKDSTYTYGAAVNAVAEPTKEGYTFSGWSGIPVTMPAKDVTVTGSFTVNTYKLTYTVDGEVYHTDSIAYGAVVKAVEVPVKEGYTFSGWVGLPETMPAKDVTVDGTYTINSYKVTYVVDGVVYKDSTYTYGAAVNAVAEPTKEGHTFSGWSGIPVTMPAKDVTVTGSFTVNTYKLTYTFAGEVYHTDSIAYGAVVKAVEVPVKEGYTFSGWVGLPETMPAKDVTVDGTYTINSYKVTYVVDGVVYKDSTYTYGAAVDAVAEPTKEGYTFSGWSGIPVTMPAKDVTVTGSFTVNTYKLTYTFAGEVYHTDSIAYGAVVKAVEVPVKEGYTFSGWVGLPETMPAKDVTVDGTYTINSYKVTYVVDGVVYRDTIYQYGDHVASSEAGKVVLVKEGHTFNGWSEIPEQMPAKDVIITGSFTVNSYKITYTLDGEVYRTDSVAYGTVLEKIEAPEKVGHTFCGWTGLPETMPAKDLTVTGSYVTNTYKLTYVTDGVVYRDTMYQYDDHVASSEAGKIVPVKEGHTFSGWSEIPERMPAKDVIITGSFTVNSYKVTYTVDGRIYHTDSIAYGTALNPIADPTKEGTTFSGWSGLPAIMPAYDVFVKATFDAKTYRVTYIVDGEVYHTDSVKYAVEFEALAEPTKEGYTFSGWSEIPYAMPAGDVTITGNFTINTYRVTYVVDGVEYVVDSVDYAGGITPMPEPTKEGHTFSGWSEIPDTMGTKDVVVVGMFTVNTYKITFTVDGEVYHTDSVTYAHTVIPATVPTKEGHTFSGWRELPRTMPAGDVVVTGFFTINTYVITYLVDGEEYFKEAIVYADVVTPIEEPEKEGYTFSGWSEIPDSMPAKNVTVRGSFILNAKQTDDQGIIYELNEARDAFEVGGYTEELGTDVVIASELYGLPVNTIQAVSLAFADMKSIVIPASITTVGRKAFGDCESLLTVEWNTTAPLSAECFSRVSNYGNMLVYVADARTEVTFQGNVVVNGVAEQITLTDGLPFDNTRDFTARSITFTRDFAKQTMIGVACGWEALVLPFDVQRVVSETRGELKPFGEADFVNTLPYWIGALQADGTFTTASGIVANKPFIMQVPNSNEYEDQYNVEGMITFSATDVTVHATADMEDEKSEGYTLLGSYQGTAADSHVCALNDEEYVTAEDIYRPGSIFVADSRDVRPFEAYVYNNKVFSSPCLRIDSQATTDIEQLMQHIADDGWYTLQGVRLDTKPVEKGIYIHNRRVVVVR